MSSPLLAARSVSKRFGRASRRHSAVDALTEVDLNVLAGRTVGIVGESGSGKSTLMRILLGLEVPSSGSVEYEGRPTEGFSKADRRGFRKAIAAVFQNPYSSFDPRMRIWESVTEKQAIDGDPRRTQRIEATMKWLDLVGLSGQFAQRFPHQLSGGQRQRVAIARAISQEPKIVLLDEPFSALDVSVSAQVMNLLLDLQQRLNLTYVIVGHDLGQIRHLSHDIYVMHRGRVVEESHDTDLFRDPQHPYTAALVRASSLKSLEPLDADSDTEDVILSDG